MNSYEFETTGDGIHIRDGSGEVLLTFEAALDLLDWLYQKKDELTRLVNTQGPGRDTGEQERPS